MALFEELGVMPAIERADFLPKHAAEFVTADGAHKRRYAFADGLIPGAPSAFVVDRSELDRVLLEHARAQGARVEEACRVVKTRTDLPDRVEVTVRSGDGSERTERACVLVDASGQSALLASRLGLKMPDPELRNVALFSHYRGAARGNGREEGDISIVLVPGGWFWVIPLRRDRTSLGFVGPASTFAGRKPDEELLVEAIARTPYLRERFRAATRVEKVRTVSDWSYRSRSLVGDRWLLVGDAGAFIDPVFSTGVHLGLTSGLAAAEAIDGALRDEPSRRPRFAAYQSTMRRLFSTYSKFVRGFYRPEFCELLLHPSDRFELRRAVISLLAGHGAGRFSIAWRVALFHRLARANRHLALAPRVAGRRQA
jgi:flavin-dependent dehydrogenase